MVRHADRGTDLHTGEIIGDVFDRRGIDIVSAADDKVLFAAGRYQPFILGRIAAAVLVAARILALQ